MGGEAAAAYLMASTLGQAAGSFIQSGQKGFTPDAHAFDAANAMQQSAIDTEVGLENKQADLAISEGGLEAQRMAKEGYFQQQEVAQQFNSAGVMLEGTPMTIINQMRIDKQAEVKAALAHTAATGEVIRRKAYITGIEGRSKIAANQAGLIGDIAHASALDSQQRYGLRTSALNSLNDFIPQAFKFPWKSAFGGSNSYPSPKMVP